MHVARGRYAIMMSRKLKDMAKYDTTYLYTQYIKLVEPKLNDIETLVGEGKTPTEIGKELNISNSLLYAMRNSPSLTFAPLRKAFSIKNIELDNVENALYRRAIGYFVVEDKPIKVKRTYENKEGKKGTKEDVVMVKVSRYVEPDVSAIKFLLVNKRGDDYHAETQKPVDNSMDEVLNKVSDIVVSVKTKADEE